MAVSLLALAQDASKTGASNTSGKNADLEKVLAAANEQWLCAGPYYKAKAQDCVVCLAKTSYAYKMNALAQSSIRIRFSP